MSKNKTPKREREHSIQESIAKLLLETGHLVIRQNSGVSYENGRYTAFYRILNNGSSSGAADIFAFSNGNAFFVEVKTKSGRLSPKQRNFALLCKKHKMDYIVARDVATVQQYIATGTVPELPKESVKRKTLTLEQLKENLR